MAISQKRRDFLAAGCGVCDGRGTWGGWDRSHGSVLAKAIVPTAQRPNGQNGPTFQARASKRAAACGGGDGATGVAEVREHQ